MCYQQIGSYGDIYRLTCDYNGGEQNSNDIFMLITNKEAASLLLLDITAVLMELALDGFCKTGLEISVHDIGFEGPSIIPPITVMAQPAFVIEACY